VQPLRVKYWFALDAGGQKMHEAQGNAPETENATEPNVAPGNRPALLPDFPYLSHRCVFAVRITEGKPQKRPLVLFIDQTPSSLCGIACWVLSYSGPSLRGTSKAWLNPADASSAKTGLFCGDTRVADLVNEMRNAGVLAGEFWQRLAARCKTACDQLGNGAGRRLNPPPRRPRYASRSRDRQRLGHRRNARSLRLMLLPD